MPRSGGGAFRYASHPSATAGPSSVPYEVFPAIEWCEERCVRSSRLLQITFALHQRLAAASGSEVISTDAVLLSSEEDQVPGARDHLTLSKPIVSTAATQPRRIATVLRSRRRRRSAEPRDFSNDPAGHLVRANSRRCHGGGPGDHQTRRKHGERQLPRAICTGGVATPPGRPQIEPVLHVLRFPAPRRTRQIAARASSSVA